MITAPGFGEVERLGSAHGSVGNRGPMKSALMPRCAVATSGDPKVAMDVVWTVRVGLVRSGRKQ